MAPSVNQTSAWSLSQGQENGRSKEKYFIPSLWQHCGAFICEIWNKLKSFWWLEATGYQALSRQNISFSAWIIKCVGLTGILMLMFSTSSYCSWNYLVTIHLDWNSRILLIHEILQLILKEKLKNWTQECSHQPKACGKFINHFWVLDSRFAHRVRKCNSYSRNNYLGIKVLPL